MSGSLRELGEFGFIDRVAGLFASHLPEGTLGIGDDCAVLEGPGGAARLVTTDSVIEGVHFLRSAISPRDLGYKSLAVNLSDIAAMGGRPQEAFLSMGVSKDTEISYLEQFLQGFHELCDESGTRLMGGDTTGSTGPLFVSVTVLGTAPRGQVRLRSMARPGDAVCVTGRLGDSGGGLRVLLDDLPRDEPDNARLLERHHRPRPHIEEGPWLAGRPAVRAMMDVSDGIDSDSMRIAERAECGIDIDLESVPISDELGRAAARYGWDPYEMAASGGEDYCLLVTVDPERLADVTLAFQDRFGRPLFAVGRVTDAPRRIRYFREGEAVRLGRHGWDHFRGDEEEGETR